MRIRKRLPPSSSPKEGLSDLQLLHRSAPPPQPPSDQSSDRSTAICSKNKKWDFPQHDKNQDQKEFEEINEAWAVEETKKKKNANNDIRKIVSICHDREDTKKVMLPSSSSTQESLCEEDYKVVPPKKRKGSFERNPNEESPSLMGAKMKSKTNKKCGDQKPPKMEEQKHGININNISPNGGVKKCKIRGNVIMEGSRCSRINGRGWRCRQPTMVGYSLCEHHLGKGRLRSIANTARRGGNVAAGGDAPPPSGGDSPLMVRKKRTKVGVVKARSMSSLLSQI